MLEKTLLNTWRFTAHNVHGRLLLHELAIALCQVRLKHSNPNIVKNLIADLLQSVPYYDILVIETG